MADLTVRPLGDTDIATINLMYQAQGFEYFFPDLTGPMMEAVHVLVDDDGKILCAVAAERIAQLYFFTSDFGSPHAKMHGMRLLHESMAGALKKKGYHEANAFIPPQIESVFGRWLQRRFGWVANWRSWCVRF